MKREGLFLTFSSLCLSTILPTTSSCQYSNPILKLDFPDPTVIRGEDGLFYAYATMGNGHHLQVATSKNCCEWSYVGEALSPPTWWDGKNTWAPDVVYDKNTSFYFMYYGASLAPSGVMCIGVAKSKNPLGPFVDALNNKPLMCGNDKIYPFQFIDPKMMRDAVNGELYLYFGSDFAPISAQKMSSYTSVESGSPLQPMLLPNSANPYENLVEGTWITQVPGSSDFILFYSGDNCCGANAHYAVMAARASKLTGPWTKLGQAQGVASSIILQKNAAFTAPGHNSLIFDDEGVAWMFYHAFPGTDVSGPRVLMMDRVDFNFTAGGFAHWPFIAGPSSGARSGPSFKNV